MSRIHTRLDQGNSATKQRQSKHKPGISVQPTVGIMQFKEDVERETEERYRPDNVFNADMGMKKAELIEIAEVMGLSTTGTKQEIIGRIQA